MPSETKTFGLKIKIRPWVPAFLRIVAVAARLRLPIPEAALSRFLATYGWTAQLRPAAVA